MISGKYLMSYLCICAGNLFVGAGQQHVVFYRNEGGTDGPPNLSLGQILRGGQGTC